MTMSKIIEDKITCPDGSKLAYRRLFASGKGKSSGVVFLGGYMSDMMGTKASYLEAFCEEQGLAFVRFDYFAHGKSNGELKEATIGRWKEDALCILDNLTEGPQILIGSSLGGWIMFLAALARKDRIKGLIGIAPAVDFVDHLIGISPAQEADLEKLGFCYVKHKGSGHTFPLPKQFVDDARSNRLLPLPNSVSNKSKSEEQSETVISLQCPVRILHGMQDDEVPWQHSIKLMKTLQNDALLTLIKQGNHRLSRPEDLQMLSNILIELKKIN